MVRSRKDRISVHIFLRPLTIEKVRHIVYWKPGENIHSYIEEILCNHIALFEEDNGEIDMSDVEFNTQL